MADIDPTNPLDNSIVSQFPANERASRTALETIIYSEHLDDVGRHTFGIGNDAARDAITDWGVGSIWMNTSRTPVIIQRTISIDPDVWENVERTNAQVKTDYEGNADTNEFSDAEKTKLGTVETNAAADQTDAEIKTAYENNADTNEFSDAEQTKVSQLTMELLATETASASATIDFDAGINFATYDSYVFELTDIVPATDDTTLLIRTSTDGGSTYNSGATDYHHASTSVGSTTGLGSVENAVFSSIAIAGLNSTATNKWGGAATECFGGTVKLRNPSNTTLLKLFEFKIEGSVANGEFAIRTGGGRRASTADIDGVRFLMDSGNITSGTIKCYGIK